MNRIIITGRLTRDVTNVITNTGLNFARFNIASKTGNKDENGNKITEFYNCVAWRTKAENMAKFCKKGNLITIYGTMQQRRYTNEDGQEIVAYDIVVEDFELFGGNTEATNKKEESKPQYEQVDMNDDDFPF